jgi:hypothetical protein
MSAYTTSTEPHHTSESTMKKALLAIIAVVLIIVSCFGLIYAITYINGYLVRGTRPLPGDAAKYDVLATYPDIVKFAGDGVQLLDISMKFVKPDGTLDLTAGYGATVSYRFAHLLDSVPGNAAPLGAGGKPDGAYADLVDITVKQPGMAGGTKDQYYNFGMTRINIPERPLTDTIAEAPTCSPKQLWDIALKHDAPANAVATIRYDSDGYQFNIADTQVYLQFDTACNLMK